MTIVIIITLSFFLCTYISVLALDTDSDAEGAMRLIIVMMAIIIIKHHLATMTAIIIMMVMRRVL